MEQRPFIARPTSRFRNTIHPILDRADYAQTFRDKPLELHRTTNRGLAELLRRAALRDPTSWIALVPVRRRPILMSRTIIEKGYRKASENIRSSRLRSW